MTTVHIPMQKAQGVELHPRLRQVFETCQTLNIHCVPQVDNCLSVGRYPHICDVWLEVLEIPEYHLTHELYRVRVWRTKEIFHVVAIGPGYLLSRLVTRGLLSYSE